LTDTLDKKQGRLKHSVTVPETPQKRNCGIKTKEIPVTNNTKTLQKTNAGPLENLPKIYDSASAKNSQKAPRKNVITKSIAIVSVN
jgi:hypothetical protein